MTLPLIVEFSGGLEILFSGRRKHEVVLDGPADVAYLIEWLCKNLMTDSRKEMFVLDDTVRPGILVLINDADWELEGQETYQLQPKDNIVFVSTLHGG